MKIEIKFIIATNRGWLDYNGDWHLNLPDVQDMHDSFLDADADIDKFRRFAEEKFGGDAANYYQDAHVMRAILIDGENAATMPIYNPTDEQIHSAIKMIVEHVSGVKVNGEEQSIQLYDENAVDDDKACSEGVFRCSGKKTPSLKGAPQVVGGTFDSSQNNAPSLKGAPKIVGVFDV